MKVKKATMERYIENRALNYLCSLEYKCPICDRIRRYRKALRELKARKQAQALLNELEKGSQA